ncbi:hypothetical protein SAMN04489712_112216 [Thermomonospora echinospora]|uniref:Excreted virulence factor EspC, type VII ESX diderm n=1 Tax=Thermomonospora echinospora TaxID=1992 RepID=A0A1H6D2D5_9ACTN|nr:hypothetical protein [Thermomonospora echinospora]SEG79440.1 hypothetical protein SAMN04489712_112216 [Thermomonospora echinospora]
MTQDRHVTSEGIGKVRAKVVGDLKRMIDEMRTDIDSTDVGPPGFGLLGEIVFGWKYREIQEHCREILGQAGETLDAWGTSLTVIQQNWRNAENANTVQYR